MKKLFLLTAIVGIFAFTNASAQKDAAMNGPKLGIGAEFAFPIGDWKDAGMNFGYGGSLQYQHPVAPSLNLTASAGYINFQTKDFPVIGKQNAGFIPVKVGARYFVAENFYVNGELGAAFGTKEGSGTRFAYSPGIGIEFPVADKAAIDLGVRYEGWSKGDALVTPSFIGVRAAFNFGL